MKTSTPRKRGEIIGAILVARGEVALRAVVEVANVVEDQLLSPNLDPRQARHIGLPVALVARPNRAPPDEQCDKGEAPDRECPGERAQPHKNRQRAQCVDRREPSPQPSGIGPRKYKGERPPRGHQEDGDAHCDNDRAFHVRFPLVIESCVGLATPADGDISARARWRIANHHFPPDPSGMETVSQTFHPSGRF